MGTRSKTEHFAVQQPKAIGADRFPTNKDMINHLRNAVLTNPTGKKAGKSKWTYFASWVNHVDDTAQAVRDLWNQEGIPVISFDQIRRRVKQCFERFKLIDKLPKAKRDSDSLPGHHKVFLNNLFDTARCKCKTVTVLLQAGCLSVKVNFLRVSAGRGTW